MIEKLAANHKVCAKLAVSFASEEYDAAIAGSERAPHVVEHQVKTTWFENHSSPCGDDQLGNRTHTHSAIAVADGCMNFEVLGAVSTHRNDSIRLRRGILDRDKRTGDGATIGAIDPPTAELRLL